MQLQAKKSLGQHFLNSKHVLEQIIEAAHIEKGETVLEIGPGTGILTEALLKTGANVVAIEKDDRAIEMLNEKFKEFIGQTKEDESSKQTGQNSGQSESKIRGRLKIIHGDVLEDSSYQIPTGPYLIVANIPYYITGAILEKFLENSHRPNRMVLLVQKEVAERIVAKDGKESILSVSVKAFGRPKIVARVPPGAFTPPPTVDSAVLAIENISGDIFTQNNVQIKHFFEVVRAGFAHKRKFAIRNLEEIKNITDKAKIEQVWDTLNIDKKIRSEKITPEQWFNISKLCLCLF